MKEISEIIYDKLSSLEYINHNDDYINYMIGEWSDLTSLKAKRMNYYEWEDYMKDKYEKYNFRWVAKSALSVVQRAILDELECDQVIRMYLYTLQKNGLYYSYSGYFPKYHDRIEKSTISVGRSTCINTLHELECFICNTNKTKFYVCHQCLKYICGDCKNKTEDKCPYCRYFA